MARLDEARAGFPSVSSQRTSEESDEPGCRICHRGPCIVPDATTPPDWYLPVPGLTAGTRCDWVLSMKSLRFRTVFALITFSTFVTGCATAPALPWGDGGPLKTKAPSPDRGGERDSWIPDLSESPPLALLLQIALSRNPRILGAGERARAAAEGPIAESWLPNPQVMIGWYQTSVETRVGSQRRSLSITQAVPFPTKLRARALAEGAEARRAAVVYERTTRDVLVEVVRSAHEIAYIDEAIAVTAEIAPLLERYVAAAAGGETGSLLPELFRAETQRAQLDNDRVILVELREAEVQHLRSLLDLPVSTNIGSPVIGGTPRVETSFAELVSIAERHNQELREAGFALEAARHRTSLAEQAHVPDLMVGATRIYTDELDPSLGMNPDGNGDDPVIFSLGVSVPLWVHRDAAATRRARALERAAAQDRAQAIQSVRDRLARSWFALGNAERLERLYEEVLVPRARSAARTAEDLMASGKGSLAGTLETIAVLHNFRLAAARARADHGRALADLEGVLGRPFLEDPAPGEEGR